MNDALELLCDWLETCQRRSRKDDPRWRELSGETEALLEAFYRRHRRNRDLIHTVNDLLDACWFQAAHESRQALLLGLQMGAAVASAGPLRREL